MDHIDSSCSNFDDNAQVTLNYMSLREDLSSIKAQARSVLVVGLGVSGVATARFIHSIGITPICVERSDENRFFKTSKWSESVRELQVSGIAVHFNVDGEAVAKYLDRVGLAVLSPGVSLESAVVGALKRRNIALVSELELGIELFDIPSAIVTGSNGKSTTVSLLNHLCTVAGLRSHLCGNVGLPVVSDLKSDLLERSAAPDRDLLVVEASSYQLEACKRIHPKVAALLNISDNHLERHGTLSRYIDAKARVFANQTPEDFALLNSDDSAVFALRGRITGKVVPFGSKINLEQFDTAAQIQYEPSKGIDRVIVKIGGVQEEYQTGTVSLLGAHNRSNIAVALLGARLMGAASADLGAGLASFRPLEHRLELCGTCQGTIVINDSKSTTVAASVAAVKAVAEAFPDRKILLMLGGLAKAGSWDPLMSTLVQLKAQLRPIICFGKDSALVASHAARFGLLCDRAESLSRGAELAMAHSEEKQVTLLSPGCASFDEFSDFEERGAVFKSIVKKHPHYIP